MMHVKYLGTDMYFNASVLWLLCFKVLPGDCHANLEIVWQAVLQWYDSNPSRSAERYSNLKLSMFCKPASPNSSFPVLKGKAAEIRALTPALYSCWCKYMDPRDTQHKEINPESQGGRSRTILRRVMLRFTDVETSLTSLL